MFEGRNKGRYFLASVFVLILAVAPVHFPSDSSDASGENIPLEEIFDSVTWSENRVVNGSIVVNPGAELIIAKGVTVEFDGKVRLDVLGKLSIEGTPTAPVVLKKKDSDVNDSYTVAADSSGSIVVRNADISGGGGATEIFQVGEGSGWKSFLKRAQAFWVYNGALSVMNSGSLDIEGVYFHHNKLAVYSDSYSYHRLKVWRSKFIENEWDVVNQHSSGMADIRYNWWGNEGGPGLCVTECYEPRRTYEHIIGAVNISPFAVTEHFRNPVIIIPGILGSWRIFDNTPFVIDPIFETHEHLIQTLDDNGYEKERDLFVFPYEWRMSNVETAKLLRTRIEEIKIQTNWPKVDIVAHSMGGLVAREYIETLNGGKNIDQLITLGTPHNGSPESYLVWEGGDFYDTSFIKRTISRKIFQQEAEENGYESIFDYLTKEPINSVRQLLPIYSYLRDESTQVMRSYPTDHPKNSFLEKLKSGTGMTRLKPVLFTNIVGKISQDDTITALRVSSKTTITIDGVELDMLWGHGKPDGYDDIFGDQGLEFGLGDGTVPLSSATDIPSDELIELASAHNELPSDAAKIVYSRLTGLDALVDTSEPFVLSSMMIVRVFSPIDIQVISPSGKRMGKDFSNGNILSEIPHAFYTGYQTENEFITIPNPEDGEYRILTEGTGDGDYRIEATKIVEDSEMGDAKESTATIRGTAETGKQEEKVVTIQDDVVTGENSDTFAPSTEIVLTGTQGQNDWYMDDVVVTLTATDNENESGVEKTEYSLDAGVTWNTYAEPVSISQEGMTAIRYFSTDKIGNREEIKTREIKIDKTAPEAKITFNKVTQKLDILGIDNLGGVVNVVTKESIMGEKGERGRTGERGEKNEMKRWDERREGKRMEEEKERTILAVTLTDPAGHVTVLSFEKKKDRRNRIDLALQSVSYDGIVTNLSNSGIQYKWQMDRRGKYFLFASHLRVPTGVIESHYFPKRNETWLMEKPRELDDEGDDDSDRRVTRKRLPGMIIPSLTTTQGKLKINY